MGAPNDPFTPPMPVVPPVGVSYPEDPLGVDLEAIWNEVLNEMDHHLDLLPPEVLPAFDFVALHDLLPEVIDLTSDDDKENVDPQLK